MKNIYRDSRHVRWNWEKSPNGFEMDNPLVRYHFVVVDDRDREGILIKIITPLEEVTSSLIEIRRCEGKVKDTKFRYLFTTFDSVVAPRMLNWSNVNKPLKRDLDLRERTKGNIEDYVIKLYER